MMEEEEVVVVDDMKSELWSGERARRGRAKRGRGRGWCGRGGGDDGGGGLVGPGSGHCKEWASGETLLDGLDGFRRFSLLIIAVQAAAMAARLFGCAVHAHAYCLSSQLVSYHCYSVFSSHSASAKFLNFFSKRKIKPHLTFSPLYTLAPFSSQKHQKNFCIVSITSNLWTYAWSITCRYKK
jgi:hypothetical protein